MYVSDKKIDEAIDIFKQQGGGVLRMSEALDRGIYRRTLYHMLEEGYITKLERGIYKLADKGIALSHLGLIIVSKKVPKAKICLVSALDFHDLTTEIPHKIHIAISRTMGDPKITHPPIRTYRFSGENLTEGIEEHIIEGTKVSVYSPAKTIADCFKFRNRIGLDIAIEALKDGIKAKKATYNDILKYAQICRVKTVIRPYMEAIAHN